MADELNRESLKTNLEQRYNAGPINTGGGDAKKAGPSAATHFISEKDLDFQANVVRGDANSNIKYHWDRTGGADRIKTVSYAPGGRL